MYILAQNKQLYLTEIFIGGENEVFLLKNDSDFFSGVGLSQKSILS